MKLTDALLLAASAAFFIMGLHQIMTYGFANGYSAVMISTILFFFLVYRRVTTNMKKAGQEGKQQAGKTKKQKNKR